MTFSIVEGNIKQIKDPVKYVEVQNINPASINNFKNSIAASDLLLQLDLNVNANPNVNYNLLSSVLEQAKIRHIPKKIQRFNRRKHCIEPWMNKELSTLINKKNDKYRDWKSTNNDIEYETKKINFKTFERIVKKNIKEAKGDYYFKTFTAHKNDLRKTWRTIDDTLNKKSNKSKFPSKFIVNNRTVTDHKKIADEFNIFSSNIGLTLSASIKLDDSTIAFTDYLDNFTEHRFSFSKITENETLTIINNLKSKNSSGHNEISNRLLKSIKCEISKPLTIIINQSLETGIFPDALKVAKVKPLFKKGDNCCLNNYRPISLNILITLYKSLFIPHINYGSLLWGHVGESIDKIQKKAIRTITYSNYIAHSEPLLKSLNLLKVKDLFNLKILKFLFNLYHNKVPPYFNNYRLDLEKIKTPYALRPHPLPVPRVFHAYAEAGLVYQLVIMQNKITVSDNLISRRIHDPNYSLAGFNQLLIKKMLDNYSYDCPLAICHTCGRT